MVSSIHSTAFAVDLNGQYSGNFVCKQINNDGTMTVSTENNSVVVITHDLGTDLLNLTIDGALYTGRVIHDAKKPEKKGTAIFIAVGTNDDPLNAWSELEKIKVKKGGGKISKRGVYVDSTGIGECKGSWKRVSP